MVGYVILIGSIYIGLVVWMFIVLIYVLILMFLFFRVFGVFLVFVVIFDVLLLRLVLVWLNVFWLVEELGFVMLDGDRGLGGVMDWWCDKDMMGCGVMEYGGCWWMSNGGKYVVVVS